MSIRRKFSLLMCVLIISLGCFFYVYEKIYFSVGNSNTKKTLLIEKGDNALVVADKLSKEGLITGKYYLVFYLWKINKLHSLVAGVYEITPKLKIPDIAKMITGGDVIPNRIPITFPEGWTAKDMAGRLTANGFNGDEFLSIVNNPTDDIKSRYYFLSDLKKDQTLEGYLFPDTYYFSKDASSQDVLLKILNNFESKISANMKVDIAKQNKTLNEEVIMASIIEREAKYQEDLKNISSVFWNRLAIGQRLESDATLEYVLDNNKAQHDAKDLQIASPYNTYRFEGLPPGPISNPGINAINAAIYPSETDYYFFLTDLKTHKTIFAKTFNEHVANKNKFGL